MKIDAEEVAREISKHDGNTKVYIGCDSERSKRRGVWYCDYMIAVVIHMNGKNGCKLFGEYVSEKDYDRDHKKPSTRLLGEAYKVVEVYLRLKPIFEKHYCEVHLDLNPDEDWFSSKVVDQAVGYVQGTCNLTPKVKPEAFAASYAADRLKELLH